MISKLAYLTNPEPGRYLLNFQLFGSDKLVEIEVAPEQLQNILVSGISLMLRSSFHRVPVPQAPQDAPHERTSG